MKLDKVKFNKNVRKENKFSKVFKGIILISLLILGVILAGCQEKREVSQELSGELKIASCEGLVPLVQEWARLFREKYPDVKINISGKKCGYVIKLVGEDKIDVGFIGRNIKPDEKKKYPDIKQEIEVGKKSVTIIVHPNNPVNELSLEQVAKIFAGDITNWKEVGGPDKDIKVIIREEGCEREILEKLVMKPYKKNITKNALVKHSYEDIKTTVSKDESSIGYISLNYRDDTVKPLKINGVEPTVQNVLSGDYPITKTFYLITKGEPSELEKVFIDFVLSEEGQKVMEDMGYIRVK